jgi:hypothetical protein
MRLVEAIKRIHVGDKRAYGSPSVHFELRSLGYFCGHNRVARLMRNRIISRVTVRFRSLTKAVEDLWLRTFGPNFAVRAEPCLGVDLTCSYQEGFCAALLLVAHRLRWWVRACHRRALGWSRTP